MHNEWDHSDLRLMELADRNPSLGGRELLREIIERGPAPEEIERPRAGDLRAALRLTSLDDPDYRTRAEQADWIGRESKLMRDLYERGAEVKGDVLVIPAEEHELPEDRETPFITQFSYALGKIKDAEKAAEFHSLAKKISGEMADARTEIVVFKTYYDPGNRLPRRSHLSGIHRGKRSESATRLLTFRRTSRRKHALRRTPGMNLSPKRFATPNAVGPAKSSRAEKRGKTLFNRSLLIWLPKKRRNSPPSTATPPRREKQSIEDSRPLTLSGGRWN